MTRQWMCWSCLLIAAANLGACGGNAADDDGDPMGPGTGPPPAEMVGTWAYQSASIGGAPVSLATALTWVPDTASARLHIQSNSAYVYEEVNATGGQLWFESGFVFIDGVEMDINAQLRSDGTVMETRRVGWMLVGDSLTLTRLTGADRVVFELSRVPEAQPGSFSRARL